MRRLIAACLLILAPVAARAEGLRVVTDIPVVHALAAQVMGDLGAPEVLLGGGADPHGFQLRPSQARSLAAADLIIWVGPELTPWLARSLDGLSSDTARIALLHAEGVRLRSYTDDHGHEHGDGHGHDDGHGHRDAGAHAEEHSATDPHAWLDPTNARAWLDAIATAMAEADPENAAHYAANAAAAAATIDAAAARAADTLAPVRNRPIIVFHDAYGYFAEAFGVTVAGSVALGDASRPGVQRLRALRSEAKARDVACIFREPAHPANMAEDIADELGIGLGTLDPSGVTLDPGPDLYADLITGMADEIARCVSGAA